MTLSLCVTSVIGAAFLLVGMARPPVAHRPDPQPTYFTKFDAYPTQVKRWREVEVRPSWKGRIDLVAKRACSYKERYQRVAKGGVPWQVVAALHNMESGGRFSRHLHEGSPLSSRTRYVPKGRPSAGKPPFTWEESANDALYVIKSFNKVDWRDCGRSLQTIEAYNGLGYQKYHKDVPSPYLWSGTTHYRSGKYVADGRWSQSAVSSQVGVAPLLLKLSE